MDKKVHDDFFEHVDAAMKRVHENLIKDKKEKGQEIVISENGKIKIIPPEEL